NYPRATSSSAALERHLQERGASGAPRATWETGGDVTWLPSPAAARELSGLLALRLSACPPVTRRSSSWRTATAEATWRLCGSERLTSWALPESELCKIGRRDSPKELEGEVDHSFFDSDREESADASDHQNVHTGDDSLKGGPSEAEGGGERKEDSSLTEDPKKGSHAASLPSCPQRSEDDGSESEQAPGHGALPAAESGSSSDEQEEDNEVEEDSYDLSEAKEESEGDWEEKPTRCPVPGRCLTRRSSGKFRSHRSPSSSGSESSHSESGSHGSEPVSPRRKLTLSRFSSSPRHQPKLATATHREKQCPSGESDDTVTDVTPLSTPDSSPVQSFDMTPGGGGDGREGVARAVVEQHSV
ncbi:hypothetical protein Z043_103688, partial [Scleropages formosus]